MQRVVEVSGLGRPTGFDLREEHGTRPQEWNWWSIPSVAFGYQIQVTPLQIATAYCSLANGGTPVTPHVVRWVGQRSLTRELRRSPLPTAYRRASDRVREVLSRAAVEGTGRHLTPAAIGLAGKSGTTKLLRAGAYSEDRVVASYIGFAPWDAPRYLVVVVVEDSEAELNFGAHVAGPVVRNLLGALLGESGHAGEELLRRALERFRKVPTIRVRTGGEGGWTSPTTR
jgi:cell division protein FtsI/penicillin-binding protein 2